ncbi:MAG: DEAD/DEAH box helicase family protein, partial [Bacteroidota bacterium]
RLIGQNRRAKPLFADYVLEYKNRRIGVVEAKKRDLYYTDGLGQAKDYAERLNIRFTYCTNGLQIYGVDMEEGTEGDVSKYPTPDELWEMTYPSPKEDYKIEIEGWKDQFFNIPFEDRGGTWSPRYYQRNAIFKVLNAIAEKKVRILLTMATGTGKTATAFQICWKLFHAKWNLRRDGQRSPRILFLADRNILADQAFNAFSAFDKIDENIKIRIRPSEIKKKGRVPKNGSIFFTIFQTFMTDAQKDTNLEEAAEDQLVKKEKRPEDFNFGQYPRDFFDFIIIDECHRGGASDESSWRAIMDYFSPAVQLGLTATPKRDVNGDTYDYFGDPIYTYALKDGINDGFLTPFKVKEIQTNYDEYTITADDTILDGEAEIGDTFTFRDYGRKIIIKQVEEYRVKKFLELINQNQKSLVFCATQKHAALIRDLINQHSSSTNTNYCHRVTADDGKIGEQHLRDFQDNEKSIPTVLTTSQKLSTGVDAPEIRNIVLLRPVDSMVEFKQIVGRGTRLFDSKDHFTVFDFVKAHDHFQDPEWDGEPLEPEPTRPYTKPKPTGGVEEPLEPCPECENNPCVCDHPPKRIIRVKLSDNKEREIDSTVKTSFWSPEGKPISAQEFIQQLFGDLPSFFRSEEELRKMWVLPSTRKKLLEELSERGYTNAQLEDLRKLIHGEESDLFDVLNYVAYHKNLVPRLERAERAKVQIMDYNAQQQEFLNFVLEQYVRDGVDELDDKKLPELLELKYKAIADAKRELGNIKSIRDTFIGFQEYLYENKVV